MLKNNNKIIFLTLYIFYIFNVILINNINIFICFNGYNFIIIFNENDNGKNKYFKLYLIFLLIFFRF